MTILDIFSKRQKRLRGDVPDVYTYKEIPQALRVQISQIISDTIGFDTNRSLSRDAGEVYEYIHDGLGREYGVHQLSKNQDKREALFEFFMATHETEKALDVVEVCFKVIDHFVRKSNAYASGRVFVRAKPDAAIDELNARFREHAVGYRYESGEIIRVDSEVLHAEVVKPALTLLQDKRFTGANDEFLSAFENYRHGKYEDSLADCVRSLESVLKTICNLRGWTHGERDTLKPLLDIALREGLIPEFLESHFTGLRGALENGAGTIGNRLGRHGQGEQVREIPERLVSYALHLTGSAILLLAGSV